MADNMQKYENWRAITEADYVCVFCAQRIEYHIFVMLSLYNNPIYTNKLFCYNLDMMKI